MAWIDVCLPFTKAHEGCAEAVGDGTFKAYWDNIGRVWTIGYGATGPDITENTVWAQQQCDDDLMQRLTDLGARVANALTADVSDHQMAALVDFAYNVGFGAFGGSTLLVCVNHGDFAGADAQFARWDKAGGQVVQGLVNRRAAEAALFAS